MYVGKIVAIVALLLWALLPAQAEDVTGTTFGIPTNSPAVLWPRGMSTEALSPNNLYPNGPEFGISTTAGGFGMIGSGRMTGVGLAQRSVSSLVQEEMAHPNAQTRRLSNAFSIEAARSESLLGSVLSGGFRTEIQRGALPRLELERTALTRPANFMPDVDAVLKDGPASTDSILQPRF